MLIPALQLSRKVRAGGETEASAKVQDTPAMSVAQKMRVSMSE
jgi:hypothetical protein